MWILGVSLVAWCVFITGVWKPGIVDKWLVPCFLVGAGFLIWWLIVNDKLKRNLHLMKDENGSFFISIIEKRNSNVDVKRVVAMEPFLGRISYGDGPKIKEIYLKLYDENNMNTLTLAQRKGALNLAPEGFFELEESDFFKVEKGGMVYDCARLEEVFELIKENKMIEIRSPLPLQ